jgi:hypothetical protein
MLAFVPDTKVLELAVDLAAGGEHLPHVPEERQHGAHQ